MPLGMTDDDLNKLMSMGQLDKSFLDQVYQDTKQDEQETDIDPAAQAVAQAIKTDPKVAAVAERTQQIVEGSTGARVETLAEKLARLLEADLTPKPPPPTYTGEIQKIPESVVRTNNPAAVPPAGNPDAAVMALPALSEAANAAEVGNKPDALAGIERAIRMQQAGVMAEANATAKGNSAIAALNTDLANRLGAEADRNAAKREEVEKQRNEQLAKLKAKDEEFNSLQIDPNRFWSTRTTEQKILAAIGVGLSTFGARYGGGNKALDVIEKAIDKDIEMQKTEIDLKKNQIQVSRNVLSDMLEVTKDIDAAENMARAAATQQASLRVGALTAQASSEVAKANGMRLMGELEAKRQEYLTKALTPEALDRQRAAATAFDSSQSIPVIKDSKDIQKYLSKEAIANPIPGVGWAVDSTASNKLKDKMTAMNALIAHADNLIKMRKDKGVLLNPYSADALVGNQTRSRMMLLEKALSTMGALDAGVERAYNPMVSSNPLTIGMSDVATLGHMVGGGDPLIAQLEQYKKEVQQEVYNSAKLQLAGQVPSFAKKMMSQDESKTISLKEAGTKVK